MKAIHFGAGNIGRGFVGLLLHEAGYEVVFADVNSELIDALDRARDYLVHEVGEQSTDRVVDNFRAINSATQEDELINEIATADIVTTAVGPTVLRFVAPVIAAGLERRESSLQPLAVLACENAINATDQLAIHVMDNVASDHWEAVGGRAIFANTAVDRIVPGQAADAGIDVTVETFYEWVIEKTAFGANPPVIPGATFVDDLAPYIERKLFTVNTGHACVAYFGFAAGITRISDALDNEQVADAARRVLEETSALLVAKHGLDAETQRAYREKILTRFANPALPDTVERVGRQPLRKLSRHERFIGPAAEIAESGPVPEGLLAAIGAVLRFDVADDEQSVELHDRLKRQSAEEFVAEVCGLEAEHPLFAGVVAEVAAAQARTGSDTTDEVVVVNDERHHRFTISDHGARAGFTIYTEQGGQRIFVHTVIDPAFGGRGLGSVLVRSALDETRAAGLRIVPVCPFVAAYVARHHDWDASIDQPTPEQLALKD